MILSWVLVYLAMVKGITESPKVVYVSIYIHTYCYSVIYKVKQVVVCNILFQVTAVFPYIVLIIFFIRAVTLRGMADGIAHLFTPKVFNL